MTRAHADRDRLTGRADMPDPRIDLINRVGTEIIQWIGEAYPDNPQAEQIAKDAIALFIGGMQEPDLVLTGRAG